MTLPKETPASEAGAKNNNKAVSKLDFIENASELLQKFKGVPYFCLFNDEKHPIGKSTVAGKSKGTLKLGVTIKNTIPEEQFTEAELKAGLDPSTFGKLEPKFLGITLNPDSSLMADGSMLVCLDFDGKKASDEDRKKFDSYKDFAIKKGYLFETSHSGKGFHVFFKTSAVMPLKKWIFSDGLELEFFPHQSSKSILLTGRDLSGELKLVEDPILDLKRQGLHEPKQISTESTLKQRESVVSSDEVDEFALRAENLPKWLHDVLPTTTLTPDGRYRAKSVDLKRNLQEDLSIKPNVITPNGEYLKGGIKDFGTERPLTPTILVAERKFGNEKEWKLAKDWLREKCGMPAFSKAEPKNKKTFLGRVDLLNLKPTPIDWLIHSRFPEGLGIIAGSPASGKTTAVIPCAFDVTGLTDVKPVVARKVVFFTEDIRQLERSLIGIKHKHEHKITNEELDKWVVIYPAQRLPAEDLKARIDEALQLHTISHDVYGRVSPLIVLDTSSANMDLADENSSAQVSAHLSALKELMYEADCSIWIVAHLAKSAKGALIDDLANYSARGSGAFEGDASWTAVVGRASEESNQTIIKIDKERTCGVIRGMEISCRVEFLNALGENRLGDTEAVPFPVVDVSIVSKNERKKDAFDMALADAFEKIKGAIENPMTDDGYLMMGDVREILGGKADSQTKIIRTLLEKKMIAKQAIPKAERSNPQRKETFILGEGAENARF